MAKILTLRGISMKDLENVSAVTTYREPVKSPELTAMPKFFLSPDEWPKKSNLRCWYCGLLPKGAPCFIPMDPMRTPDDAVVYGVYGHFHTFNCAISFVYQRFSEGQRGDLIYLIHQVERKFSGVVRQRIEPAPDYTELKMYRGPDGLSEDQFNELIEKKNAGSCGVNYSIDTLSVHRSG